MKPGLIFGFCVLAILLPVSTFAQTADELFDPTTLHDIRLRMNARDLQSLHERWLENTFYPGELEFRCNGLPAATAAEATDGAGGTGGCRVHGK
jgi:hypothetical protein